MFSITVCSLALVACLVEAKLNDPRTARMAWGLLAFTTSLDLIQHIIKEIK